MTSAADIAPMLRLRNVEACYGPVMAIRGVSLDVEAGAIAAVLGANGAGKTTILKTISGILEPLKGELLHRGASIGGRDPSRIVKAGIGHVPEGREVFPFLTVADNLRMGAFLRSDREGIAQDLARVYEYFPALEARRTTPAGQLSGGEQQMLAIGRALMNRPELLLLDEPSLGLSPRLVKEIFAIIMRINREQGVTILLVEQNAHMALKAAGYAYVLENGRIVLEGSSEELARNADIREFYLGLKEKGARAGQRWRRRKSWG